jgi:bilirubin oxidase
MSRVLSAIAVAVWALGGVAWAQHHPENTAERSAPVFRGGPAGSAVLKNASGAPHTVEVTLTAEPARLSLVPGTLTDVYAYNGRVPGPTLDVREGDRVIVHFLNRLPEPTTVHWHGLHIPFASDGTPFHPIAPGEQHDYVFTLQRGSAGTYWYHPHPHADTGPQVARGLYGSIIVRAADDPLRGIPDKLLVLSDNRFLANGAIDLPSDESMQGRMDWENGREGEVLFVNGERMPTIGIRAGEVQRWRIVNASAARVYKLALPGHTLLHVGSDGGLFERAVEVSEITLANGERAEVLVRGTAAPGNRTILSAMPYDRYVPQTRPEGWDRERPSSRGPRARECGSETSICRRNPRSAPRTARSRATRARSESPGPC